MPDHYTHGETEVLVNRFGITDLHEWKRVETAVIGQRFVELTQRPSSDLPDLDHLQKIHRDLVQDLYAWGGQLRDTDTGPGGTGIAHARPEFIPAEAQRIFGALADAEWLRDRDADAFSTGLAWAWGETTALHPFRDVNTRSQFVLFTRLAEQAGWIIDWSLVDVALFAHARTVAIVRDEAGIDALLFPALLSLDDVRRRDEARDRATRFFDSRRDASPSSLDRELKAAIRRRNAGRRDV